MRKAIKQLVKQALAYREQLAITDYPKIFCIGKAKTGTTSLHKTFKDMGFMVGDQRKAERLLPHYLKGDFKPIIKYCRSAQVFQDSPFGLPDTFKHLDEAFIDSRFILTVRDSPEQWYNSLVSFHAKLFGGGLLPTAQQLKDAEYVWKGWVWEGHKRQYGVTEEDPYNKEKLIYTYNTHIKTVVEYFKYRPESLLVLNLSTENAFKQFHKFVIYHRPTLFKEPKPVDGFPWENRTADIRVK